MQREYHDNEIIMAVNFALRKMDERFGEEKVGSAILRWAIQSLIYDPFRPLMLRFLKDFLEVLARVPTVN